MGAHRLSESLEIFREDIPHTISCELNLLLVIYFHETIAYYTKYIKHLH